MTANEAKSTRDKLIDAAMQLFWERGYHATGNADILKVAGVGAGSLYHFFESKEALLNAVLDRFVDLLQPAVMGPAFATTDDPIERVFAVLAGYRRMLLTFEFRRGCPIGNLALEMGDRPIVREKVAQNFANWCKAIEQCLDAAADRLPPEIDRAMLSRFVLTVMEGGIMQARALQAIEPYDQSVAQLRDYFTRLRIAGASDKR